MVNVLVDQYQENQQNCTERPTSERMHERLHSEFWQREIMVNF